MAPRERRHMRILHTADWHLGISLGTEKRADEFDRMLAYILEKARETETRCVIISGDVFDAPVPPNQAVAQYYRFLVDAVRAGIRDVIVTAGNHDSPSFLEAPRELLKRLNVHVFGKLEKDPADQLVVLKEDSGKPCAVVAAIPYLHIRDVRETVSGEGFDLQHGGYCRGVLAAYRRVCACAKEKYPALPLLATAHFWALPGTEPDPSDQMGFQAGVPVGEFPESIDYLAMGHIHTPGPLPYRKNFRYAGSVLPLTFGEAGREKSMVLLDTDRPAEPETVALPVFRNLEVLTGTMPELLEQIGRLREAGNNAMLDVCQTGPFQPRLRQDLDECCADSGVSVIFCRNQERNPALTRRSGSDERLADLAPETVFARMLDANGTGGDERAQLLETFREALKDLEAKQRGGGPA